MANCFRTGKKLRMMAHQLVARKKKNGDAPGPMGNFIKSLVTQKLTKYIFNHFFASSAILYFKKPLFWEQVDTPEL